MAKRKNRKALLRAKCTLAIKCLEEIIEHELEDIESEQDPDLHKAISHLREYSRKIAGPGRPKKKDIL